MRDNQSIESDIIQPQNIMKSVNKIRYLILFKIVDSPIRTVLF